MASSLTGVGLGSTERVVFVSPAILERYNYIFAAVGLERIIPLPRF